MALYKLYRSSQGKKKYLVRFIHRGHLREVHFGHVDYQDYTQHGDEQRRHNYLRRSAGIRDGSGQPTKDDPMSPNYWSRRILWASGEPFYGLKNSNA